jgi:hypothetical protein
LLQPSAKLNPLSGVRSRAAKLTARSTFDEELVWIMLDRLGIKHPEAAGIRKCRAAPI